MTDAETFSVSPGADVAERLADAARVAAGGSGDLELRRPGLILPDAARADLARRADTFALVAASATGTAVRTGHGRVLDVATDRHELVGTGTAAIGLVRVAAGDRPAASSAWAAAADEIPTWGSVGPDAFGWSLLVLVRAGIAVRAEPVEPWPWTGDGSEVVVSQATAERVRLTRANRADDSWYSVSVLRRLSKPVTAYAARRGWAPNAITLVSLLIGLAAAALFAVGSRWALVVGAVLLQVSLVVDCSDGEVARLTGRFSRTGAWLDAVTDRVKEFAAYAGLAAGAAMVAGRDLWWAAAATVILQTVRHLTDYTFDQVQQGWEDATARRPLSAGAATGAVPRAPAPVARNRVATMLRRTLFLPIGERWLVISLTAALLGPAWTFGALLGLGLLSFCYANLGRVRRSSAWRGRLRTEVITSQLDTGVLGGQPWTGVRSGVALLVAGGCWAVALAALLDGRFLMAGIAVLLAAVFLSSIGTADFPGAWAAPAVLAGYEMIAWLVAGIVLAPASGPWVFLLLFALAFHRYDLLYRAVGGGLMPTWLRAAAGGTSARLTVLAATLVAAPGGLATVVSLLAVYLVLVTVVVASAQWLREQSADAL